MFPNRFEVDFLRITIRRRPPSQMVALQYHLTVIISKKPSVTNPTMNIYAARTCCV
jgi:hypothetical protein